MPLPCFALLYGVLRVCFACFFFPLLLRLLLGGFEFPDPIPLALPERLPPTALTAQLTRQLGYMNMIDDNVTMDGTVEYVRKCDGLRR